MCDTIGAHQRRYLAKLWGVAALAKFGVMLDGSEETHGDVHEGSAGHGLGVLANPGLGRSRLSAGQVFVNGNTTFTVTWQGVKPGATLLATATFTVSNWTGKSFVMTVTNVANTMATSPNINGRLTAFGFGLMPEGTFSNLVQRNHLPMGVYEFPGVSTCRCVFDERWGLRRRRGWRSQSRSIHARQPLCHDYR